MRRYVGFVLLALLPLVATAAENAKPVKVSKSSAAAKAKDDAKELSGMSVLGNTDTPKALAIVPWKSSELGPEADLRAGLLNDAMAPVDKEVFMRELQFYRISSEQQ